MSTLAEAICSDPYQETGLTTTSNSALSDRSVGYNLIVSILPNVIGPALHMPALPCRPEVKECSSECNVLAHFLVRGRLSTALAPWEALGGPPSSAKQNVCGLTLLILAPSWPLFGALWHHF